MSTPTADVERVIEPLLRFHETGGHEGDGSDERLAMIRAALSASDVTKLRDALTFYAEQWEQDIDAEQTAHGWVGSIGQVCPTEALCEDAGRIARQALNPQEGQSDAR